MGGWEDAIADIHQFIPSTHPCTELASRAECGCVCVPQQCVYMCIQDDSKIDFSLSTPPLHAPCALQQIIRLNTACGYRVNKASGGFRRVLYRRYHRHERLAILALVPFSTCSDWSSSSNGSDTYNNSGRSSGGGAGVGGVGLAQSSHVQLLVGSRKRISCYLLRRPMLASEQQHPPQEQPLCGGTSSTSSGGAGGGGGGGGGGVGLDEGGRGQDLPAETPPRSPRSPRSRPDSPQSFRLHHKCVRACGRASVDVCVCVLCVDMSVMVDDEPRTNCLGGVLHAPPNE